MDIIPFRDYSDALTPLPALPTERSETDTPSSPAPSGSFQAELEDRLSEPLFDLASPLERPTRPVEPLSALETSDESVQRPEDDELMLVCREIEGLMLSILLKNLGKNSFGDTIFSRGWESSMYQDMFFEEMAKSIGGTPPGLGIANVLYNDIIMKAGGSLDQLA
jgi:hypothetical protein